MKIAKIMEINKNAENAEYDENCIKTLKMTKIAENDNNFQI